MCLHLHLTALTEQLIYMDCARWHKFVNKSLTSMTAKSFQSSTKEGNIAQILFFKYIEKK